MDGALHYDRHVAPFVIPYTTALVEKLADPFPRRLLDHGAGTGAVTAAFHAADPSIMVTALDPSREMLHRIALQPQVNIERVEIVHGRVDDLASAETFDAIASQLVFMFVPDVAAELVRLRSFVVAGARIGISVLRGPESVIPYAAFWNAAHAVDPDAYPADHYPHFRFADPELLEADLTASGWCDVEIQAIESWREVTDRELWTWLRGALPVYRASGASASLSEADAGAVRESVLASIGQYQIGSGQYRLPMHGWLITARAADVPAPTRTHPPLAS